MAGLASSQGKHNHPPPGNNPGHNKSTSVVHGAAAAAAAAHGPSAPQPSLPDTISHPTATLPPAQTAGQAAVGVQVPIAQPDTQALLLPTTVAASPPAFLPPNVGQAGAWGTVHSANKAQVSRSAGLVQVAGLHPQGQPTTHDDVPRALGEGCPEGGSCADPQPLAEYLQIAQASSQCMTLALSSMRQAKVDPTSGSPANMTTAALSAGNTHIGAAQNANGCVPPGSPARKQAGAQDSAGRVAREVLRVLGDGHSTGPTTSGRTRGAQGSRSRPGTKLSQAAVAGLPPPPPRARRSNRATGAGNEHGGHKRGEGKQHPLAATRTPAEDGAAAPLGQAAGVPVGRSKRSAVPPLQLPPRKSTGTCGASAVPMPAGTRRITRSAAAKLGPPNRSVQVQTMRMVEATPTGRSHLRRQVQALRSAQPVAAQQEAGQRCGRPREAKHKAAALLEALASQQSDASEEGTETGDARVRMAQAGTSHWRW
jgi:hypothetical protein